MPPVLPARLARHLILFLNLLIIAAGAAASACAAPPADDSPRMLVVGGQEVDPAAIDYTQLPVLHGQHAVVCPQTSEWKFQLHNYLVHHDGRYWCMWSHGPEVEDLPTQHVRYATSDDGLKWTESKMLSGPPDEGYGYIARGFWLRDGELLALAAHFKGKGAFGVDKDLMLRAFAWDASQEKWTLRGVVYPNAINNFAPEKLPSGEWMTTRRDARFNVTMLIGGVKAIDDWQTFPVVQRQQLKGFSPDEPIWYPGKDGRLVALFRDNGGSNRMFRAFSGDNGRTWSTPAKTNFPNAPSKLCSLQTSSGYRVLISNANPGIGRRQMHLSVSADGVEYTRLARLDIPSPRATTFQYPHAIEHDGQLLIAFSNKKAVTEVLKVPLAEVDKLVKE